MVSKMVRIEKVEIEMHKVLVLHTYLHSERSRDNIHNKDGKRKNFHSELSPGRGSPKICQIYLGETQIQWTRS